MEKLLKLIEEANLIKQLISLNPRRYHHLKIRLTDIKMIINSCFDITQTNNFLPYNEVMSNEVTKSGQRALSEIIGKL